jgi:hypothetical protein
MFNPHGGIMHVGAQVLSRADFIRSARMFFFLILVVDVKHFKGYVLQSRLLSPEGV